MYVKESPYDVGEETIFETPGRVRFGVKVSDVPPDRRDYNQELGGTYSLVHVDVGDDPDGQHLDSSESYWIYRYATWPGPSGYEGVVTRHRLFILSDAGKTIDSVR